LLIWELGIVQSIIGDGALAGKMDGGRSVSINPRENIRNFDHGYATTSQGQTTVQALVNIDIGLGGKDPIIAAWLKHSVEQGGKVYRMAEHERHWEPFNEAITPQEAQQFA
jgi:hypothetical protein